MKLYRIGKVWARVPMSRMDRIIGALLGFRIKREGK